MSLQHGPLMPKLMGSSNVILGLGVEDFDPAKVAAFSIHAVVEYARHPAIVDDIREWLGGHGLDLARVKEFEASRRRIAGAAVEKRKKRSRANAIAKAIALLQGEQFLVLSEMDADKHREYVGNRAIEAAIARGDVLKPEIEP